MPASPAYDCQLVLVTNETAVLTAVSTCIVSPWWKGRTPCATMTRKSSTTLERPTGADGAGVDLPALLLVGVDPARAVEDPLGARVAVGREDVRQVATERHVGDGEEDDEDADGQQPGDGVVHQNRSGLTRAYTR